MKIEDLLKLGYTKKELKKVFESDGCLDLSEKSSPKERESLRIRVVK